MLLIHIVTQLLLQFCLLRQKKKKRKKKTEALEINLWICSLNWLCEGWRGRRGCGRAEARPTCRPVIEKMSERNHSVVYIKRKDTSLLTWNTKVLGWYMHRIYPSFLSSLWSLSGRRVKKLLVLCVLIPKTRQVFKAAPTALTCLSFYLLQDELEEITTNVKCFLTKT